MMKDFSLHPRLAADCYELGKLSLSRLLLFDNAYCMTLQAEAQQVSEILEFLYEPKRVNVGALGNLVPQLHYHVVARTEDDPAWPGPVWGSPETKSYTEEEVAEIKATIFAKR